MNYLYETDEFGVFVDTEHRDHGTSSFCNGMCHELNFKFVNKLDPKKRLSRKVLKPWLTDQKLSLAMFGEIKKIVLANDPIRRYDFPLLHGPLACGISGNSVYVTLEFRNNTKDEETVLNFLEHDTKWCKFMRWEDVIDLKCPIRSVFTGMQDTPECKNGCPFRLPTQ